MEIQLRPWTQNDREALLRYANNPAIAGNMTDAFPYPFTEEASELFLAKVGSSNPPNILAIGRGGEAVGAIGIHPQTDVYRRNAELGYWLAEPLWGQGIMSRAIGMMVHYGWENWPELTRIFARPYGSNIGSQKALEKAGFRLEARLEKTFFKNGVFEDELIYAVRRQA